MEKVKDMPITVHKKDKPKVAAKRPKRPRSLRRKRRRKVKVAETGEQAVQRIIKDLHLAGLTVKAHAEITKAMTVIKENARALRKYL